MNDRDMSIFELIMIGGIGDDILLGYCDPQLPYYFDKKGEKHFNAKYFYKSKKGFIKRTFFYYNHFPKNI